MKRLLIATLALFAAFATASSAAPPNAYIVHNLASNIPGLADNTNADVVNAWGLDANATSPWWISDNGTDLATVHTTTGAALGIRPTVAGGPTGLVATTLATATSSFHVNGSRASFLFSTEEGVIRAWRGGMTEAAVVADRSAAGAIYKGLAIAASPDRLYATDFHNGGVDVFDANFNLVSAPGAFTDPDLPRGFAPFGIQNVGGTIVVTFAKQDQAGEDEVQGQGARDRRCVRPRRQLPGAHRYARPAGRPVGHRPGAGRVRTLQRRPADRQLRRRRDHRLRPR